MLDAAYHPKHIANAIIRDTAKFHVNHSILVRGGGANSLHLHDVKCSVYRGTDKMNKQPVDNININAVQSSIIVVVVVVSTVEQWWMR